MRTHSTMFGKNQAQCKHLTPAVNHGDGGVMSFAATQPGHFAVIKLMMNLLCTNVF